MERTPFLKEEVTLTAECVVTSWMRGEKDITGKENDMRKLQRQKQPVIHRIQSR
jgi:hypothetical protein